MLEQICLLMQQTFDLNKTHFDMTKYEEYIPRNEITTCDSIVDIINTLGLKMLLDIRILGLGIIIEALPTSISFLWPTGKGQMPYAFSSCQALLCLYVLHFCSNRDVSDVLIEIAYFCYFIFISRAVSST